MSHPANTKKLDFSLRTVTAAPTEETAEPGWNELAQDELDAVTGGPFPPDDIQSPA